MRLIAVALLLVSGSALSGDLPPEEWDRLRFEAARLKNKPGESDRKEALVRAIRQEDSVRAARLLASLAASSAARRADLTQRASKARDAFLKLDGELRRRYGLAPEMVWRNATWKKRREASEQLAAERDAESAFLKTLGAAVRDLRSPEAVAALADVSDPEVAAARRAGEILIGILDAMLAQPGDRFDSAIVAFSAEEGRPYLRIRILDRIAERKLACGFEAAVACLGDEETLVARVAVATLKALDDRRAVRPLTLARACADGLLAAEIDQLLHRFTGKGFRGMGAEAMWAGWWKSDGEAWLAGPDGPRFEGGTGGTGGAEFYGIETPSNRIVFVLDRSHSMREPVPRKGPVTGKRDDGVQGGTKLEVAKNQLERTIRSLRPDVKFAVVFYDSTVEHWQEKPELAAATADAKQEAIAWFSGLEPQGTTSLFDALTEALRYAGIGLGKSPSDRAGADTIFLLSDGAPTLRGGSLLPDADIEVAVRAFFDANRTHRCVVHTIGVGPDHNRDLMAKLARETGGTYREIGAD